MKNGWICLILCLAMLLVPLSGCNSPDEKADTTKQPATAGNPLPAGALALVHEGRANFTVVYSMSGGYADLSNDISDRIEEATGVKLPVENDYTHHDGTAHEIRVGKVSRMDALSVYDGWSKLGKLDYAVAVKGGHIYIYGTTETALENAVAYFFDRMLMLDTSWAAVDGTEFTLVVPEGDRPAVAFKDFDGTYTTFTLNEGEPNESEMRISLTPNEGWRIQTKTATEDAYRDMGAAQRLAASLGEEPPLETLPVEMEQTDTAVTLRAASGSYAVINTETFQIDVYTATDKCAASITKIYTSSSLNIVEGVIDADEAIYGTGERFNSVDQRGRKITMYTLDSWSQASACYMVIPLMTFSRGSGVLMNNYEEMIFNLGDATKKAERDTWRTEIYNSPVDCYVFATDRMADTVAAYTDLSGHAEMPEEWSYGMLVCRISPDLSQLWGENITNKTEKSEGRVPVGAYDMIAYMEAYDLPWTGLILEGWGPYNTQKYDDLKELCDYVHSLGKKVLVYMRVGHATDNMSGYAPDYLLSMTLPSGEVITNLPAAETTNPDTNGATNRAFPYLDITNPEACEWFFDKLWNKLANEIGVDGCKIDFCEELPEYYELNYYDEEMPTLGSHHWYPTAFCAKYWDMISSKPDSGMCYTRGGGLGSQRSPYMWAGDQTRRYTSLQWQLNAVLSSGLSGVPFMSYDMSGYQYGNDYDGINVRDPEFEAQVFIRGLQFTAFTVCMQTHGKVRNVHEFAAGDVKGTKLYYCAATETYTTEEKSTVNGERVTNTFSKFIPTTTEGFDPKTGEPIGTDYVYEVEPGSMTYVVEVYSAYVKLHEWLTPYITEYSAIACETGMPLMRHLALGWQDDPVARDIEDEYTFGDAFLVAPVLTDAVTRDVYLPEGEWLDLNTGLSYTVGADGLWLEDYDAPVTTLPLFYNQNTTSTTAEGLLPGIAEIFAYVNGIDVPLP
ncbi:MAG: glycoside hydrolase family 31 protein [Clostridia bacterium]|nr:glycoside hydrolase family 31 protein [Clostridia bacterium]